MNLKKVVITGIGVVSPIGSDVGEFTARLREGRPGMKKPGDADPARFGPTMETQTGFPVLNFNCPSYAKILEPNIQYSLKAAEDALRDASVDPARIDPERVGIAVSTSKGGVYTIEKFFDRFQKHPSALLAARVYANIIPNISSQWIARHWKLRGPAKVAIAACATGLFAIMEGIRMIEQDEADYCIAGAGDASMTPLMTASYRQMGALSAGQLRPFDLRRDGFLIGEGAGVVILESEENARARGAKIYGRVLAHAYGFESSDAIFFSPEGDGLSGCLGRLLAGANIRPRNIDYINLHGTGTRSGDLYESAQLKKAFGKDAYGISMSSTKSLTGHMLGAAGAVEVITALVAMKHGFVPPTANLEQPDPACDLDYTPLKMKEKRIDIVSSISLAFGGQLGAILIGRP